MKSQWHPPSIFIPKLLPIRLSQFGVTSNYHPRQVPTWVLLLGPVSVPTCLRLGAKRLSLRCVDRRQATGDLYSAMATASCWSAPGPGDPIGIAVVGGVLI